MEDISKEKIRNNAKIYLLFVALPVITYLLAHYILLMNDIYPPANLYYELPLIFGVLFISGVIVAMKKSLDVAITALLIPVVSIALIFLIASSYSAYSHAASDYYSVSVTEASDVYVYNASKIPDNYTQITEKELDEFPKLKKSLKENRSIELTGSEFNELDRFLTECYHGRPYIKYKGEIGRASCRERVCVGV